MQDAKLDDLLAQHLADRAAPLVHPHSDLQARDAAEPPAPTMPFGHPGPIVMFGPNSRERWLNVLLGAVVSSALLGAGAYLGYILAKAL